MSTLATQGAAELPDPVKVNVPLFVNSIFLETPNRLAFAVKEPLQKQTVAVAGGAVVLNVIVDEIPRVAIAERYAGHIQKLSRRNDDTAYAHQDQYTVGTTTFKTEDTDTLTGVLGARYAYDTQQFGIRMNLAAIYDFISDKSDFRATSRGTSMYVNGERLHRFGGEAGIAATFKTGSWEFELGYDAQVRKDYNDQTVSLKAGLKF